jgi:hypothetical protein
LLEAPLHALFAVPHAHGARVRLAGTHAQQVRHGRLPGQRDAAAQALAM